MAALCGRLVSGANEFALNYCQQGNFTGVGYLLCRWEWSGISVEVTLRA